MAVLVCILNPNCQTITQLQDIFRALRLFSGTILLVFPLLDSNSGPQGSPPLKPGFLPILAKSDKGGPIFLVFIFKVAFTFPSAVHEHLWGEVTVFDDFRIELDFLASNGINEWHDEFEKCVDIKGNFDNECFSEPFRIVVLQYVEYSTRSR